MKRKTSPFKRFINYVKKVFESPEERKKREEEIQKKKFNNAINQRKKFREYMLKEYDVYELVNQVNDKIQVLSNLGLVSSAYERLKEEVPLNNAGFIEIEPELETTKSILQKVKAAEVFNADISSTVKGAEREMYELQAAEYKGMFGNQWKTAGNQFRSYSPDLDEEVARVAFAAYREVENKLGSQLLKEYGSENLITYLYSTAFQQGYRDRDDEDTKISMYLIGMEKIRDEIELKNNEYAQVFTEEFSIYKEMEDYYNRVSKGKYKRGDRIWDFI